MTFGAPQLDDAVRRLDGDRVLLGGSPRRLLTLSDKARGVLARADWDSPTGRALASKLIAAGFAHPTPRGGPGLDEVSVVIPVRDREMELRNLLAGLDPALEVIVVDDGSQAAFAPATIRHPTPQGPAAARNAGIAAASRPFVAVLDSDVVVPDGWLDRAAAALRRSACGGRRPARRGRPQRRTGGADLPRPRPLRRGALPARSRPLPRAGERRLPGVVRPRRGSRAAPQRARRAATLLRRGPALRRGRRSHLAAHRSRLDGALRAGGGRRPCPPHHIARGRRPAFRLRLIGRSPGRAAIPGSWPRSRSTGGRSRPGRCSSRAIRKRLPARW